MKTELRNAGRIVCAVVMTCMLVVSLGGCAFIAEFLKSLETEPKTDEQLIEERIERFAEVYNNGDYDGVLECLDTKTRNTVSAMMNVGAAILGEFGFDMGISLSDLFSLGVGLIGDDEILTFDIHSIDVQSANLAVVEVTMKSAVGNLSEAAVFTMRKEDDDWYIRNLEVIAGQAK